MSDIAASSTDRWSKPTIIFTLCLSGLVLAVTEAAKAWRGAPVPEGVDRLALMILGGLFGLLGRTASEAPAGTVQNPTPVQVQNSPADPVEVHAAGTPPAIPPGGE